MVRCIIPARKNSARIARKNLMLFHGRNLIELAIEAALKSNVCDQTILSTDLDVEMNNPKVILDKRPKHTAGKNSRTSSLIKHIAKKHSFEINDCVILLQPTSPLRTASDVKKAYNMYKKSGRPVVSVCEEKNLSDNLCTETKKNNLSKILPGRKIYRINGAIFIFSLKQMKEWGGVPQDDVSFIKMDENRSIDIDEYSDFIKAVIMH